jgi:hypothetical protein
MILAGQDFRKLVEGSTMSSMESVEAFQLRVAPEDLDSSGFASLWNIASATSGGGLEATRTLAAQLLGFLCQKGCDFVVVSTTDAEYLDAWFERDNKLLYDWKPDSEKVDVLSQHAEVPFEALVGFLKNFKFNPSATYSPKRADRVEWFTNQWNLG